MVKWWEEWADRIGRILAEKWLESHRRESIQVVPTEENSVTDERDCSGEAKNAPAE
jgi:hypothetical protein